MNEKLLDQDEIKKMLATMCKRPLPKEPRFAIFSRIHAAFEMGKQWEKIREEKLCLCPKSSDCWNESDGRCTHV